MTSSDSELKKISTELKYISLKRQQLLERKKIQCIFQELRNRAEFEQTEEADSKQLEIDSIDDKLKQLTERKAELQNSLESILNAKVKNSKKEVSFTSIQPTSVPGFKIFYVEPPPAIPAPSVILDMEKLPPCPCRTQCPECRQFITTETFTSVSSVTWLVCFMTALIGCVAGCCLIPFCLDKFKSTTHQCPKCRAFIRTIKKL
ncbi:cell death-inducing p53-target protein 1-like [Sander lucioperca]|uniref:cell death-inducing p53-target protein 1-like n=1 Tax=Sander lucioperca TaxID=283035 RepID=UPI00125CEBDF|nr:cell death-inducing p53-target protein 1-like [Sander lucioperca]XP_031168152.1 cell death-inducing p53-target protein 1-like [Sander lucioperca]